VAVTMWALCYCGSLGQLHHWHAPPPLWRVEGILRSLWPAGKKKLGGRRSGG
jgi:hypothetical protein